MTDFNADATAAGPVSQFTSVTVVPVLILKVPLGLRERTEFIVQTLFVLIRQVT